MLPLGHVQIQIIQVSSEQQERLLILSSGRGYPEPYHNPNGWPPGPGWQDSYNNPGGFGRRTSPSHPGGPPGGRWDDKADWNDPG